MQLEIGKKYRTRNVGIIVRIDRIDQSQMWSYIGYVVSCGDSSFKQGDILEYDFNGDFDLSESGLDLVEEVTN